MPFVFVKLITSSGEAMAMHRTSPYVEKIPCLAARGCIIFDLKDDTYMASLVLTAISSNERLRSMTTLGTHKAITQRCFFDKISGGDALKMHSASPSNHGREHFRRGQWPLSLRHEPLLHNAWVLATTLKIAINATFLLNRKLKPGG
jgi:hypothetical protein